MPPCNRVVSLGVRRGEVSGGCAYCVAFPYIGGQTLYGARTGLDGSGCLYLINTFLI